MSSATPTEKTKLYTIYSLSCNSKVYIGKTTASLDDRFYKHKSAYKNRARNQTKCSAFIVFEESVRTKEAVIHKVIETTTDPILATSLERDHILCHRERDECVNKRLPDPKITGKGSVGTAEYRKQAYEKKQMAHGYVPRSVLAAQSDPESEPEKNFYY